MPKAAFIEREPDAALYFRPFPGAREFIRGSERTRRRGGHVCSYCGHDLHASRSVPLEGPSAERMLWYAGEGARLVHAGEAIALAGLGERGGLTRAYRRLAELARERDLPAVERFFGDEVDRAVGSKIEALLSALWRLRVADVLQARLP